MASREETIATAVAAILLWEVLHAISRALARLSRAGRAKGEP